MAYGDPLTERGGGGLCARRRRRRGISLYESTPADFGEIGSDPANLLMQWGPSLAAWAREFSFVEYEVDGPVINGRAFGWADVKGQNDIPQGPATYDDELVPVDPDKVEPELKPRTIDEFTVTRKPDTVVRAADRRPRSPNAVLRGVPEARGILIPNLADDCTRHHRFESLGAGGSASSA